MTGRESTGESSATDLLTKLAGVLNECSAAGMKVKFKHGAAYCREGYVLPVGDGRWVARTLLYTELAPAGDDEDD